MMSLDNRDQWNMQKYTRQGQPKPLWLVTIYEEIP